MTETKATRRAHALFPFFLLAMAPFFHGCLSDNVADDANGNSCSSGSGLPCAGDASLVLRFAVQNDANIPLQSLKFRFTSNLRDTVVASQAIATLAPDSARIIERGFTFAPLRWWNLEVQALDSLGNVQARGAAGPFASRGAWVRYDSLEVRLDSFRELLVEGSTDLR